FSDEIEVSSEILPADMLEHADTGDLVEGGDIVGDLAVVAQPHLAFGVESLFGDTPLREGKLSLAQSDARGVDAVVFCSVKDEASPAAAYVQHLFSGLEAQLFADEVELVSLGVFESLGVAAEVGARVHHRRTEPGSEELRRPVVVPGDGASVAAQAVHEQVVGHEVKMAEGPDCIDNEASYQ